MEVAIQEAPNSPVATTAIAHMAMTAKPMQSLVAQEGQFPPSSERLIGLFLQ